jgi:hypothetical protein
VFVYVGQRNGTPVYALPMNGEDGFRRYKVGTVRVAPRHEPGTAARK